MTRWAVVVITDGNLVDEATRLLAEVTRLGSGAPDLFCFTRDLDAAQRALLARVPRLTVLDVAGVEAPIGPPAVYDATGRAPLFYARFECWSDRFDAYDTVVYLDVDTAVIADLHPLSELDFYATFEVDGRSPFIDEHDPALVSHSRSSIRSPSLWPAPFRARRDSKLVA